MIGLGAIAPGAKTATPTIDPDIVKETFAKLYVDIPMSEAQAKNI